jgi:hypothetical protein
MVNNQCTNSPTWPNGPLRVVGVVLMGASDVYSECVHAVHLTHFFKVILCLTTFLKIRIVY